MGCDARGRAGCSYWLVEPEARIFEVFELGSDGRYIRAAGATAGRVEDIAGYEGLVVDVDALWAELERLA